MPDPAASELASALDRALGGELEPLEALTARLASSSSPLAAALTVALAASRALFARTPAADRAPEPPSELPTEASALGAALAVAAIQRARLAILGFDRAGLDQALSSLERLCPALDAASAAQLWLATLRLWARLYSAEPGLESRIRALFALAAEDRNAPLVLELTSLRAMALLADDRSEEALAVARQAARMARAEGLAHAEVLAAIVLARARRRAGKAHLASRVLSALDAVAPAAFRGWLAWERVLVRGGASAALPATGGSASPAGRAAGEVCRLLEAARLGDRAAFERAAERIGVEAAGFSDAQREGRALVELLDLDRDASDVVAVWRRGERAPVPFGLEGVCGGSDDPGERAATLAFVRMLPGHAPGRVLSLGAGLDGTRNLVRLGAVGGQARTETGLAALALAGAAGLTRSEFFVAVYGFPFRASLHQGVLDVLVHRMRARVAEFGDVVRSAERLALTVREATCLLADPRCARSLDARLLAALAQRGNVSAGEAARELELPLRTVQALLQQLVSDGACEVTRSGRQVTYKVVDTTFTSASLVTLAAADESRGDADDSPC